MTKKELELFNVLITIFKQLWYIEWASSDSENNSEICEATDLIAIKIKSIISQIELNE